MFNYTLKNQGADIIDTVLTNRNLTLEEAKSIISASIENDRVEAYKLKNIDRAAELFDNAIKNHFKIGILIDSDCDGYCSAAMMYDYITNKIGYRNVIYKFHDKPKGHGLQDYVIKWAIDEKIEFLIVPDAGCGASDEEGQRILSELGVDILILDHHIPEYVPCETVVIVNPHQDNDNYFNKYLSGAGVTHKFIEYNLVMDGMSNKCLDELYDDLFALSLVSDMMDLKNSKENRAYLNSGTKCKSLKSPFMSRLFCDMEGNDKLSIEDLGFSVAPLVNATVRFGSEEEKNLIFRSLFEEDTIPSKKRGEVGKPTSMSIEAIRIAGNLKRKQDRERDKGVKDIQKLIEGLNIENDKVIMLIVDDIISSSITGLVANKLVDLYKKPVMLLKTTDNSMLGGSVRTVNNNPSLRNFKNICIYTGLFEFCSGHQGSFGVGLNPNNFEKIRSVFNEILKDINTDTSYEIEGIYNQKVPFADIRDIADLKDLWCFHIKEPIFLVKDVRINTDDVKKIGNATYTFNHNKTIFTKFYGSKVWFSNFILQDELSFGGDIIVDMICKFKKIKNEQGEIYLAEIVDAISVVNDEYDF